MSALTLPPALQALNDPLLTEAYQQAAQRSVLAALNPSVFFGYFSVCADGGGHGGNTTYPGLDWGQSAEALLLLGREAEVLASWDYVMPFQREDGLFPFAILPDSAGQTVTVMDDYPLTIERNGGIYRHWVPGNPLRILANVTVILTAGAIYGRTGGVEWLRAQSHALRRAAAWLAEQVSDRGWVAGAGFYVERPTRIEYDGVAQCMCAHAFGVAAELAAACGEVTDASHWWRLQARIAAAFRTDFWAGTHCVEYIHPERGPISHHGLTDVDWAAIATAAAAPEQVAVLWPQLRECAGFLYGGMPTGISTRPETYEDWEMQGVDRHDLAAMGRVWYLECWARSRMGDREGIVASLRRVAEVGRANDWYWKERYHPPGGGKTAGDMNKYVEYPANLIRIVHRFLG